MSTSNFHNVNANRIFACEIEEDFDYDDLVSNLKSEFSKLHECSEDKDPHELRSYSSNVITAIYKTKSYKDFTVEVKVNVVIRNGYYSGVNLDWFTTTELFGQETDVEYFADELEYQLSTSRKNAERIAKYAEKWAEKAKEGLIQEVETIFEQYSTPLVVVARFSNGETVYEKADNKRSLIKSIVNS